MQITFINSVKAKKIVNYYLVFLIGAVFLLAYLGGDNDYLTSQQSWVIFYILSVIMFVIGYIYVFTYPKEERKEFWITHIITIAFFACLNLYLIFFR
ncbi:hypothetical protein [Halalkalibacter alkalisediminis]|uniref:Uncharacterized protein n=1 Tax=Halalkalibacter alkalisediminis TaxID=935616 RepID=A0ABV6NLY5_9BACI